MVEISILHPQIEAATYKPVYLRTTRDPASPSQCAALCNREAETTLNSRLLSTFDRFTGRPRPRLRSTKQVDVLIDSVVPCALLVETSLKTAALCSVQTLSHPMIPSSCRREGLDRPTFMVNVILLGVCPCS